MGFIDTVLRFLPWLVFGQGMLLAAAVLSRWNHRGNRYLGSFLILLSFHGLMMLLSRSGQGLLIPELSVVFSSLPFLYGPLVYRYVWHSFYRDWDGNSPFILHAFPGILNILIYGVILAVVGRDAYTDIVLRVYAGRGPVYVIIIEYLKILHGLFYSGLIIQLFIRQRNALARWTGTESRRRWLMSLIVTFTLNWVLVVGSAVFLLNEEASAAWRLAFLALQLLSFLVFLYIITFFSMRYPVILDPKEVREAIRAKLNLPEGFVEETINRLEKAEKRQFFTDSEVTLPSLADELGLHPNALSYIINEERGKRFREYLNSLRLDFFLEAARDAGSGRTHLEMAYEAGFASKTTFLRAFRARYGATPAEYLAK